ncbi:FAD-dependent monooxygenase [Aquabacterium sp. A08]|uniref:FAD-dependent monooxygenase n=1 Tax=Aquabacterium sp. A08 TaxID=2718532 RepID=UPI00141EBAEF|nr:FAD-dependent monooxygenase [Aquabacterium sp. A08]NIC42779.1 FAD-dependent oxidoreductase [Aquabacterium sp. A08]
MQPTVAVVGGGIAGLGAALAVARARPDAEVLLLEQAPAFAEVGAGIQLGPNATRVLRDWGLETGLRESAAFPQALSVREVAGGAELGRLRLGERAAQTYGAPYATVHRADLHELLQDAVAATGRVQLRLNQRLERVEEGPDGVDLHTADGGHWRVPVLLGCDGVWSRVRARVWGDAPARFTGHLAYRGMVPMAELPPGCSPDTVTAWLGPRLHAVHYPVRGGAWMNVVVVVHGEPPADPAHWDHCAHAADLKRALGPVAPALEAVLDRVLHWRLWPLHGRAPMAGPQEHVRGRIALLGDAAHPMRPYLAQGAAMALEDAWTLGRLLAQAPAGPPDWAPLLRRWADTRWVRNAWVQARSRRNGSIFHAQGPLRWGRNLALWALGESLLDVPTLYSGPPNPPADAAGHIG